MKPKATNPTKYSNIAFAIIPKSYWVVFAVLVIVTVFTDSFDVLTTIGFNVLLFLVGTILAVVIHEIGHLVIAKAVGGTPRRLEFGRGYQVAKTKLFGIKIILNSKFNAGFAYSAFNDLKFIRLKLMANTFGGILFNLSFATLFIFVLPFSIDVTQKIQVLSILGVTNLLCGLYALFPYYVNYQGLKLPSDGLKLFKIPFYKKAKLMELNSVDKVLDAMDFYEDKKYEEALDLFESFSEQTEGSKLANSNISLVQMKLGNFQKAYDLMIELLPQLHEEQNKLYTGLLYNNLAWCCLLLNKLEEADKYSKLAIAKHQNTNHVRGTRGSVLIELGQYALGKQILLKDVDFNFPNSHTLTASLYLALAFQELNEPKESLKYIQFVHANVQLLDLDEKALYDRIVSRLNKG